MKEKKELLLPAGSMEALKMAVHNGADAIYVGGKRFGARAFAPNFSLEDLSVALQYCHLYGVKLYVTVNTIIFDGEMESAIEYVSYLYEIGVDAIIICDLGLIRVIHEKFPDLELHLSTQAHTFSENQFYFWKELGIKRIVVDRELSLAEIKELPDILDIEVFIHGALCVSYSGQCYLSYMNSVRSGNRGSCAQLCRMPYELYYHKEKVFLEDKYLLSPKELNTSRRINELMKSKIKSFKIEGRMKSPEYVGFITRFYRNIMDGDHPLDKEEEKNLKYLFNREFTEGYLFGASSIMNMKTSNHQGVVIGNVIDWDSKKIKIKLSEKLTQEDGIRFQEVDKGMMVNFLYDKNGKLIHEALPGEIIYVDNKVGLKEKCVVRKTISKELQDSLKDFKEKKIDVQMEVAINIPSVTITIRDEEHTVTVTKEIAKKACNKPMTREEVARQVAKLGNTPFKIQALSINMSDDVFIPISKLNELRRECAEKLIEKRISSKRSV